jgi:phenylpropionate dioxygenase-like ring-hydroxylating dioxygenase large terminal subunit
MAGRAGSSKMAACGSLAEGEFMNSQPEMKPDIQGDDKPKKKAPRAPGLRFSEFLQAYTKHPVPDYLFIDKSEWLGDKDIDVDRYLTREAHELEKEKIWKKVWQMACREEEIPEVGDAITYEITNISILIVRTAPSEIKAYYNVCLHQGRRLRNTGCSHNIELRCSFHGFCWHLDGKLKQIPSEWDFPHIKKEKFDLREVKVGRWGGFVFINMDPNCESLESYMTDMPRYWEKFPLEKRYIAAHVAKIFAANWKGCQEAFMEGFHMCQSHPQFTTYTGNASDGEQLDAFENYSRGLGQGSFEIPLAFEPTPSDRLKGIVAFSHPEIIARMFDKGPIEGSVAKQFEEHLNIKRDLLREIVGEEIDSLSDFEVGGGGYFTLFPNFHPWWAYDEIVYRIRPYKDEHERCLMEIYLLRPFKGERPKPAPIHWLGEKESFWDAPELGLIGQFAHQDEYNIAELQAGFHNLKTIGKGTTHGIYHSTKIRHFHKLWDKWVYGKPIVRDE